MHCFHYSLLISQCSFSWIFNNCGYQMMEIISCSMKRKIDLKLLEVKRTTENRSQFAFIAFISLWVKEVTQGKKQVLEGCSYKRPPQEMISIEKYFLFPDSQSGATFSVLSLSNAYVYPHPVSLSDFLLLKDSKMLVCYKL